MSSSILNRTRSLLVLAMSIAALGGSAQNLTPPNVVILLADNLGYEDVSWFAKEKHNSTPNIDSLGRDGMTFTNWNSAAHLCSASRAALLTGLYPARTGIFPGVFHPDAGLGLQGNTLATYLKKGSGYSTAAVGKWHLGHLPPYLPTSVGFDRWMGVPYHMSGGSVDDHTCVFDTHHQQWLPLYRNATIVEQPVKTERLADYYKKEASDFIMEHTTDENSAPFFLYMAFSHVHQLCASATLPEPSVCQWAAMENATFLDAVKEMDSIVGAILESLRVAGVEDNTIVIFTSDNGPWVAEQSCSGLKGPFQAQWFRENVPKSCTACPHDYTSDPTPERPRRCLNENGIDVDGVHCGEDTGLGSVWEANLRMPTLMRWPNRIVAGKTTDRLASSLDVVPTVLSLANSQAYNTTSFDGVDLSLELLENDERTRRDTHADSDDRILFFWRDGFLSDLAPLGPPCKCLCLRKRMTINPKRHTLANYLLPRRNHRWTLRRGCCQSWPNQSLVLDKKCSLQRRRRTISRPSSSIRHVGGSSRGVSHQLH